MATYVWLCIYGYICMYACMYVYMYSMLVCRYLWLNTHGLVTAMPAKLCTDTSEMFEP